MLRHIQRTSTRPVTSPSLVEGCTHQQANQSKTYTKASPGFCYGTKTLWKRKTPRRVQSLSEGLDGLLEPEKPKPTVRDKTKNS